MYMIRPEPKRLEEIREDGQEVQPLYRIFKVTPPDQELKIDTGSEYFIREIVTKNLYHIVSAVKGFLIINFRASKKLILSVTAGRCMEHSHIFFRPNKNV